MDSIPSDVLNDIFVVAGAWEAVVVTKGARKAGWFTASSVSRSWRDSLVEPNGQNLSRMMIVRHGSHLALIRAAGCPTQVARAASHRLGHLALEEEEEEEESTSLLGDVKLRKSRGLCIWELPQMQILKTTMKHRGVVVTVV